MLFRCDGELVLFNVWIFILTAGAVAAADGVAAAVDETEASLLVDFAFLLDDI